MANLFLINSKGDFKKWPFVKYKYILAKCKYLKIFHKFCSIFKAMKINRGKHLRSSDSWKEIHNKINLHQIKENHVIKNITDYK